MQYMIDEKIEFLMEVTEKTKADIQVWLSLGWYNVGLTFQGRYSGRYQWIALPTRIRAGTISAYRRFSIWCEVPSSQSSRYLPFNSA